MTLAIRYYRKQRGLTQTDIARRLNIYQSRISSIELGKEPPSDYFLNQLADILDVSPAYLLLRRVTINQDAVCKDCDEQVSV